MSLPSTSRLARIGPPLPDVQSEAPLHALALNAVGIRGLRLPVRLDSGPTVVTIDATVDVPVRQRGAHMSRFYKAVDATPDGLTLQAFCDRLLDELTDRHDYATKLQLTVSAPVITGDVVLDTTIRASRGEPSSFSPHGSSLSIRVQGSTVCPCSFAMSGERYAHAQRAEIALELWNATRSVAELHDLLSNAFSAPVAMVLDRPGEKALVDRMFSRPRFVEDVAREAVAALQSSNAGSHARIEARAFESIHPYDCVAAWEGEL